MIPSLEGMPTKAKEAPSPHEVRLSPLDTNPVFHSLGGKYAWVVPTKDKKRTSIVDGFKKIISEKRKPK